MFWGWKNTTITYEHRRSQVKLVKELRNKDVYLEHLRDVLSLDVPQDVNEPLKVTVGGADPEKVYLKMKW